MAVNESVIRLMTRLAIQHGAVNLSQGFTDESPDYDMVWGGIAATLGGTADGVAGLESMTLRDIVDARAANGENSLDVPLKEVLAGLQNQRDQFNQYSFPFGIAELRQAIADYYQTFYGVRPDPDSEITVVLGASEGMAVTFRGLLEPGDGVLVMQPFHELYPSQARIFGFEPRFTTLREDRDAGIWHLDRDEMTAFAKSGTIRAIVINTPHNPTGKVLTDDDMAFIASLCRDYDLWAITDEIYEHMTFDGHRHHLMLNYDGMAERTVVVNSISKTGKATGWRIGWVIAPAEKTRTLRAIHDNLTVQAPTPLQKGAVELLRHERAVFDAIAPHYVKKRDLLVAGLRDVGFSISPPEGAYYLFAGYRSVPALAAMSPKEAAMYLIETIGVATVPGDNFYATGNDGDGYLRFAACRSEESLNEAIARLGKLR